MTETQAKELTDKINTLVHKGNIDAAVLKVNLIQAEATLKVTASNVLSPVSDGSMASSGIFAFQAEIAKHLAELKVASEKDKSSAPKNMNNFGFSKIQVPEFSGNIREFTKWRIQVEDYLNKTASRSTERQAVNHLDRLTPKEIDVSRCMTLKDAWKS